MINRISRLTLGVLCALGCGHAAAMGLGPIEVRSGLNQPLFAEIPILSEGESVDELRAQLAGPEDLRRVGIDTSALSVQLEFDVVEDSRGRPVIRVTSNEPVREPYLSFLVEANWGKGRLLREYSVLLDPPVFASAVIERVTPPVTTAPAAVVAAPRPTTPAPASSPPPRMTPPAPVATRPSPPAPMAVAPPPLPAPAVAAPMLAPAVAAPRSDSYTVQAGDALYDIASARRADANVSVNQMMVAMLRANPSAFYKDNINALKKGAVLRIPDASSAREVSAAAAAAEVAAQARAWSGADAPALVADSGTSAAPPASSTSKPATSPSARGDRLALVPPKAGTASQSGTTRAGTAGGTGAAEATELRGDLARTREQLTNREQEAVELRSRVKDLEKIGGERKRLIELKNNEIVALKRQLDEQEKRLADAQQAAAVARAAAVKAGTPTPALAVVPDPVNTIAPPAAIDPALISTESSETSPTTVPPAAAAATAIDPMQGTALANKTDPMADASPGTVIDPASESVADTADSSASPNIDADAAGAMPVDATSPPAEVPATPARPWYLNPYLGIGAIVLAILGLLAMFGRRRPPEVLEVTELTRPSVADDFASGVLPSSPAPAPMTSATLAAPILGDDVLERALLDRRASDPDNLEHHLDVLRHYHELRDDQHFMDAASNMRNHVVDEEHYAWLEAQELGRDIDATHPLFAGAMIDSLARSDDDYNFRPSSEEPLTPVGYHPAVTAAALAPVDLGDDDWDHPRSPPVAVQSMNRDDFSVSMPQVEHPVVDTPELTHYQFDELPESPRPASSPVLGEDAVATKLDLARAYIDMGDNDGARAMLQEVLAEGSGAQQGEAQRLIDSLS